MKKLALYSCWFFVSLLGQATQQDATNELSTTADTSDVLSLTSLPEFVLQEIFSNIEVQSILFFNNLTRINKKISIHIKKNISFYTEYFFFKTTYKIGRAFTVFKKIRRDCSVEDPLSPSINDFLKKFEFIQDQIHKGLAERKNSNLSSLLTNAQIEQNNSLPERLQHIKKFYVSRNQHPVNIFTREMDQLSKIIEELLKDETTHKKFQEVACQICKEIEARREKNEAEEREEKQRKANKKKRQ